MRLRYALFFAFFIGHSFEGFASAMIPTSSATFRVLISSPSGAVESATGPFYGPYANEATCLADMAKQKSIFTENTGLVVSATSCDPDQLYGETFILAIEGVGNPTRHLYAFEPFFREAIVDSQAAATLSILQQSAFSIQRMGSTFLYYAEKPAPIPITGTF